MNVKLWIVTVVDHGDTCDGKARVLDMCTSKEEAKALVRADIEKRADERAGLPIIVDFDKMSAKYDWKTLDADDGCEWNIEEWCGNIWYTTELRLSTIATTSASLSTSTLNNFEKGLLK